MRAADVMNTKVITVSPDTPLSAVAEALVSHHISAVPVVDAEGRLAGIVSEGDLLRRHETGTDRKRSWWLQLFTDNDALAREYVKSHGQRASDVMTRDIIAVGPEATLGHVAGLLEKHRIKRVPVVEDGRLKGIVSRADLVRALASATATVAPKRSASDDEIRTEFERRLKEQDWAHSVYVQNSVHDGFVELFGLVRSDAQRKGLVTLAETIPGIKGVEDNLQVRPVLVD